MEMSTLPISMSGNHAQNNHQPNIQAIAVRKVTQATSLTEKDVTVQFLRERPVLPALRGTLHMIGAQAFLTH